MLQNIIWSAHFICSAPSDVLLPHRDTDVRSRIDRISSKLGGGTPPPPNFGPGPEFREIAHCTILLQDPPNMALRHIDRGMLLASIFVDLTASLFCSCGVAGCSVQLSMRGSLGCLCFGEHNSLLIITRMRSSARSRSICMILPPRTVRGSPILTHHYDQQPTADFFVIVANGC